MREAKDRYLANFLWAESSSVNSFNRKRYFSQVNDGGGQVVQGDKGGVELFMTQ